MGEIVFVAVLLLLIIIFFSKKEYYIYVALFFYLILPEYCAISLGSSLPTLTASRGILILLFFTTIFKSFKINLRLLNKSGLVKYFLMFFITETIVFLAHLNVSQHIKDYLGFIVENVLFLILFINNIDTENKLEKLFKMLSIMAGIVSIFSIFESFTDINVAELLDTGANTSIIAVEYQRLDVRRATFSLGHPICLSIFLGMIVPCIMYCINKYNTKLYKIIFILTVTAIVLTISRGPIAIIFVFLVLYIFTLKKEDKKKYVLMSIIAVFFLIFACLISNRILSMITGTVNSILKEIGFNVVVDEAFGNNTDGKSSRLNQWTALPDILDKYPLCGGGSYYIYRNKVPYTRTNGAISYLRSIDCEYLSVLVNKGIIGFIGIICLYLGIAIKILFVKDEMMRSLKYGFFIAIFCYITVCQLTTVRIFWVIISMIVVKKALLNNKENHEKGNKK